MERKKYQTYINNYRRKLSRYIRGGVGISCNIYPSSDGGAILEFTIGESLRNGDVYEEESRTLSHALSKVKQRAFGGDLSGFHFGGTNTILEGNRFIYIKDSSPSEWGEKAATKEVEALVSRSRG